MIFFCLMQYFKYGSLKKKISQYLKSEAKSIDMTNEEIIQLINARKNHFFKLLHIQLRFTFKNLFIIFLLWSFLHSAYFIYFSLRCSFTPQKFKRFTVMFSVSFFLSFLLVTKKTIINKMFSISLLTIISYGRYSSTYPSSALCIPKAYKYWAAR